MICASITKLCMVLLFILKPVLTHLRFEDTSKYHKLFGMAMTQGSAQTKKTIELIESPFWWSCGELHPGPRSYLPLFYRFILLSFLKRWPLNKQNSQTQQPQILVSPMRQVAKSVPIIGTVCPLSGIRETMAFVIKRKQVRMKELETSSSPVKQSCDLFVVWIVTRACDLPSSL
jgi:hypothetical protein